MPNRKINSEDFPLISNLDNTKKTHFVILLLLHWIVAEITAAAPQKPVVTGHVRPYAAPKQYGCCRFAGQRCQWRTVPALGVSILAGRCLKRNSDFSKLHFFQNHIPFQLSSWNISVSCGTWPRALSDLRSFVLSSVSIVGSQPRVFLVFFNRVRTTLAILAHVDLS